MTVVLDSWAVLRYLEDHDPAAGLVAELLTGERPWMSWINIGEVFSIVRRAQGEQAAAETVRDLERVVGAEEVSSARTIDAARIKADHPLAYADAFAAATAIARGAELWTGDPELLVDGAPWRWRDLRG